MKPSLQLRKITICDLDKSKTSQDLPVIGRPRSSAYQYDEASNMADKRFERSAALARFEPLERSGF
jgi:hypothetical protein